MGGWYDDGPRIVRPGGTPPDRCPDRLADYVWVWKQQRPPAEKLLLLAYADGENPAPARLATVVGITETEVRALTARLTAEGVIVFDAPPESSPYRRSLPAALRRTVMERDGYRCRHCGTGVNLSIDHIYPVAHGGTDDLDNLQVLCCPCNSRKGARLPMTEGAS
jgi:hypothetical protein